MTKTIEVEITNNGFHPGTLGWLAKCPLRLKIGETKQGKQAAFLYYRDSAYITLAVRGYDEWTSMCRVHNAVSHDYYLDLPFAFSDAAFAVISSITDKAVELMNELWERKEEITLEFTSPSIVAMPPIFSVQTGEEVTV